MSHDRNRNHLRVARKGETPAEPRPAATERQPRLLDQVRNAIRVRHMSIRTEEAYVSWIRRFILFHEKKHPSMMGAEEMDGVQWLMATLLYGAGLRQIECLRLRVKDLEFSRGEIIIRDAKGAKDRMTILPDTASNALQSHLMRVKVLHGQDLANGFGEVYLPFALARKYPSAASEWGWQWIFPAEKISRDPRSGKLRRHHAGERSLQRAVKEAVRRHPSRMSAMLLSKLGSSAAV